MKDKFFTRNTKQMMGVIAVALLMLSPATQAFVKTDRLVIESIQLVKPSGKIDSASMVGFRALKTLLANGGTVASSGAVVVSKKKGGRAPVTAAAIAQAAAGGSKTAATALKLIKTRFSGQDDLIVDVNGQRVLPDKGQFHKMKVGQVVKPKITVSFKKSVTISLIEYDTATKNDDLGHITVNSDAFDKVKRGINYRVVNAIVLGPKSKDSSIYYVTYHVERGMGNRNKVVNYLLCGTTACMACPDSKCNVKVSGNINGDKDKGKLKKCPSDFKHASWKKYKHTWPATDVYLQVCTRA